MTGGSGPPPAACCLLPARPPFLPGLAGWPKPLTTWLEPLWCRARFQEVLGWQRVGQLVLRQQCTLLAAVAGASGGAGANELPTQALGLLPANPALALHLLTALAQEAEDLDRVRRLALVNVLLPRARELLGALGSLLAAAAQQLQQGDRGG